MTQSQATDSRTVAPRLAAAWAALTYALCALSLSWPALLGKSLLDESSDQFRAGVAFRQFAADYFRQHGAIPLWNPYLQGGMPYVGAMHGDIFYPTFLLRLVMPVDVAIAWGMIGHFFLCGMATYWFIRVAGRMAFGPALVGGVAYMMAGFVSSLISPGHDGKLFVNALFPVLLTVLVWAIRDGKQWAFGAVAAVTGLMLLTPHPQLFEQGMVAAALWALFLAYGGTGATALDRGLATRRLATALLAVAIGTAMGAIQYMPAAEYTAWSPRANGVGWEVATSFSFPIEELFNLYLPQFSGILDQYWGRNGIHFHSEYAGVVVLMLAGAAFGAPADAALRRFVRCWMAIGTIALLWALGEHTPFFRIVYATVPMVKYMRAPSTMFFVTTFAIAMLAAAGSQRLLGAGLSRRYLAGWVIAGVGITLLALSGALGNVADSLLRIPEFADRISAGAGALKVGALRSLAVLGAAAGLFAAISSRRVGPRTGVFALAVLVAIDLWSVDRLYWRWGPSGREIYATDPAIAYLKALPQPARVLSFSDESRPSGANDPYLGRIGVGWDGLMVHGIRQTYGYQGNSIRRYAIFAQPPMWFNPTTWALTNTRYVLSNLDSLGVPGEKRVVGPVRNSAGTMVSLIELPGRNPFAWVAPLIAKYPDDQLAREMTAPNFPSQSIALIDPGSATPGAALTAIPAPLTLAVQATTYQPGRISLSLAGPAPAGSALVVSENFYPGWTATVDGKPATVERMNFVLMGVPLPAGARSVDLAFSSPAYERGRAVSLAAVAVATLWLTAGAALGRRRPAAFA
jgi:hypothetical protein